MGSYQDPAFRPSGWEIAGDHETRIGILEAVPEVDGIRFDTDNQGGYLDVQANDSDGDGYGIHFNDDTGDNGSLYEAEQSILLRRQDGTNSILIGDGFSGTTLHSAAAVTVDAATFAIVSGATIDGGGNIATNFADGVAATDLATVGQLPAVIQTRELISGDPVTIADSSSDSLTWDSVTSGTALLDLTNPAAPEAVDAGVYAITVCVTCTALTLGGVYVAALTFDLGGENANTEVSSAPAVLALDTPEVSLAMTRYIPAGGVVDLTVTNRSGASEDFSILSASVQRLS